MNIAQRLKLRFNVSGKEYLESQGIDCRGWTNRYRATTYGWEFEVFDEKGERRVDIYCEPDHHFYQVTTNDGDKVAKELVKILEYAI